MLNEKDIQRIREEAERLYSFDIAGKEFEQILRYQRQAYIAAATLRQERINGLVEALEGIQKFYGRLTSSEIQQIVTNTLNNY